MPHALDEIASAINGYVGRGHAVIEILVGPRLNKRLVFSRDITAFPLTDMGNRQHIAFGTAFLNALKIPTDARFEQIAVDQGARFHSASALVLRNLRSTQLKAAAAGSDLQLARCRTLLSVYVGGAMSPIVRVQRRKALTPEAEFLAPKYRGIPRGDDDLLSSSFVRTAAEARRTDDRLHYWLETLEQTYGIEEQYFRIARLYSLLEGMAGPVASSAGCGTRTAIRLMLGYYIDYDVPRFTIEPGEDFEFDHIELAGRVRDKIFHGGGRLATTDVPAHLRPGIALLESRPELIAYALRRDAEFELSRWSSLTGVAWRAANGEAVSLPARDPNYSGRELAKLLVTAHPDPRSGIGSAFVKIVGGDISNVRLGLAHEMFQ